MVLGSGLDGVVDLERAATGPGGLFYGVYPAIVTDIVDPDNQGRVKVRLPWSPDADGDAYETWARLTTMMGGPERGTWFVPDVGDEVIVSFEGGNTRRGYVLGGVWNGRDAPPERMDGAGANNLKTILSRKKIRITMDDTDSSVKLRLETPGGQSIVLSDSPPSIVIKDASGNSIKLETQGITITGARVTVNGTSGAEINTPLLNANAATTMFTGTVQCPTHLANTVISGTYMPGVGNLL